MSNNRPAESQINELLSAMSDGECRDDEVAAACASWRQDADTRSRWHAYQLIGDVLRSDDLASTASRDAAFVSQLRRRLEQEPVVLAPTAAPTEPDQAGWRAVSNGAPVIAAAAPSRRRAWAAPLTMAFGFVAVTALWVGTLHSPQGADGGGSILAWMTPERAAEPSLGQALAVSTEPSTGLTLEGSLLRDAELDRYLQAQHPSTGATTLARQARFLTPASSSPSGR